MAEYQTDEEKVEAIREWWKENGRSVIAGIILGVGGLFGWKAWTDYRVAQAEQASIIYATMQQADKSGNTEQALSQGRTLRSDYASTPYAALGALEAARLYVKQDDLAAAETELRWAVEHARQESVKEVAKLRLARVLIAQNALDEAQAVLEGEFPSAYLSLVEELKGDLYRARGELELARQAYDRALITAGQAAEYLQMKRDDLGESSNPDESS